MGVNDINKYQFPGDGGTGLLSTSAAGLGLCRGDGVVDTQWKQM